MGLRHGISERSISARAGEALQLADFWVRHTDLERGHFESGLSWCLGKVVRMYNDDRGLLQGTLDLLILRTLSWGRAHGYHIASWIEQTTGDALRVEEGSLYPALHRLERKKLIESEWGLSENNRKAKYYELTRAGRAELRDKTEGWARLVEAVAKSLNHKQAPSWAS